MSRHKESFIAPNYEELVIVRSHENQIIYSSGSIQIMREETVVTTLGFEVYGVNFNEPNIQVRLPQIDTPYHEQGKGYGSIALQKLIAYAIELRATQLSGNIWNQGDLQQLENFYKKNFATLSYQGNIPTSFSIDLSHPELLHAQIEKAFYQKRMRYLEPYREKHDENMKFVTELALRNQKTHWFVKWVKKIVGEE